MPNTLTRERPARSNKEDLQRFFRELESTARRAQSITPRAGGQASTLRVGEFSKELKAALGHLRTILSVLPSVTDARALMPLLRVRAQDNMRSLIAKGELVPAGKFAQELDISRQALSKAVTAQRMFFIELGGERYFPSFFLDPKYQRQQLERVSQSMGELPGASKLQFFATKRASLAGQTPLQALANGKFSRVREVAAAFAER